MKRVGVAGVIFLVLAVFPFSAVAAKGDAVHADGRADSLKGTDAPDSGEDGVMERPVADPIEPLNRAIFVFNDKLYFWVLKPVAQGYGAVVPEWGRIRVRNVFQNITVPVRFVNSLLQLKVQNAAKEMGRFLVNTTAGLGGMFDILEENADARPSEEDLGQTLGSYGLGEGFYLVLPLFGPSSLRDTAGRAGDYFLDPVHLIRESGTSAAVSAYDRINSTSLTIGVYEDLVESAIDPYTAVKDAYLQHRRSKVRE